MSASQSRVDREDLGPEFVLLSSREREVLDAAVEGQPAREIARRLSLSEATVRSHLSAIYSKVGVSGRVELLARLKGTANRKGFEPDDSQVDSPAQASNPRPSKPSVARRLMALVVVLSVLAFVATAFLIARPDLPERSDIATVSRLLAANQVAQLDLQGERLTVTERSGGRLRVEGVTFDTFQPIELTGLANSVAITAESDSFSLTTELAMIASSLLPPVLLVAALLLILRATRRPPRVQPAG